MSLMIQAATICALALATLAGRADESRFSTCYEVATAAQGAGLDPRLIVSIAWVESRFVSGSVSGAGARGPLQVMPRYFCPNRTHVGCDLVKAGIGAFKAWRRRYPVLQDTLCHYNAGNRCTAGGTRYARAVLGVLKRLSK